MKILLAGGGTAGHINPALAIAGYACEQDNNTDILYVGAKGGMEEKLVRKAGYNIKTIEISGFQRKINIQAIKRNLKTIKNLASSVRDSKKIIKEFNPDICIGTGGYVSGPVIKAAQKLRVPTLIHEQNAFPGVTNKMLAKKANVVMLAIEDAKKHFNSDSNFEITGNPVRGAILKAEKQEARKKLKLDNRLVILSFGGSLGARVINESVLELTKWNCKMDKYQQIHGYGRYGKFFLDELKNEDIDLDKHKNLRIVEYIDNMPDCLAAADLVICRAGAITISELQAMGKPSILIPSPNVAENHQFHNAMALVNRSAAKILEEKDLTGKKLIKMTEEFLNDSKELEKYGNNASKMAIKDSNERIYRIIKRTISDSRHKK